MVLSIECGFPVIQLVRSFRTAALLVNTEQASVQWAFQDFVKARYGVFLMLILPHCNSFELNGPQVTIYYFSFSLMNYHSAAAHNAFDFRPSLKGFFFFCFEI